MSEISNRKGKPPLSEVIIKNPNEKPSSRLKDLSNLDLDLRNQENDESYTNKKINSLIAEVDRLSQENKELGHLLHEERTKTTEVQKRAKNSGKIKTIVDRNLQNELKHEKEELVRLRHMLSQIETERNELLSKIKDFEILSSTFAYEKKQLLSSVQDKIDLIKLMESENRKLVQALADMNDQFVNLGKENTLLEEDRKRLCDSLIIVENQKAELENRFRGETEKLLQVSSGKQNEIENIKFVHDKHSRVLASCNILLRVRLILRNTLNTNFTLIRAFSSRALQRKSKASHLILYPQRYISRSLKSSLDKWRSILNYKSLLSSTKNLVSSLSHKSFLSKHFSEWRNLFMQKTQLKLQHHSSCLLISKASSQFYKRTYLKFLQIWRTQSKSIQNSFNLIEQTLLHFKSRKTKTVFKSWKEKTQNFKKLQTIDDLASDFAGLLLKCKYFKGLRLITETNKLKREFKFRLNSQADMWHCKNILGDLRQYNERSKKKIKIVKVLNSLVYKKDLAKALEEWKKSVRTSKEVKNIDNVLKNLNREIRIKESEKCFFVWKEFMKSAKLARCLNQLAAENRERIQMQDKVNVIGELVDKKEKFKAFKVFVGLAQEKIRLAVQVWKDEVLKYRKKGKLMNKYFAILRLGKAKSALVVWKRQVNNLQIVQLTKLLKGKQSENELMTEHIQNLEVVLKGTNSNLNEVKLQTMKRVLIKICNLQVLSGLRKWAKTSFIISNKLNSATYLNSSLSRVIFRLCLKKISSYSLNQKHKKISQTIINKLKSFSSQNLKSLIFSSFLKNQAQQKYLKKQIHKFLIKKSLTLSQTFIQKWVKNSNFISSCISKQQYSVLLETYEKVSQDLDLTTQSYIQEQETRNSYFKNLQKRSSLRILNFFRRYESSSLSHYFSKWNSKLKLLNTKKAKLFKVFRLWLHGQSRVGFNKWLVFMKAHVEAKAQIEIKRKIAEKKAVNRENKEIQGKLEADVNVREIKIKQLDSLLTKEMRVKEFLLMRCVRQSQREYSENRAAFAFRLMKKRYLEIKDCTVNLAKILKFAQKRKAFGAIVETVKHIMFVNNLYDKLFSTFHKCSRMYLKRIVEMWRFNSYEVLIRKKEKKINNTQDSIKKLNLHYKKDKEKYGKNTISLIKKDKKRRILQNWFITSKKLKSIKGASELFTFRQKSRRFQKTFKLFSTFTQIQQYKREKSEIAIEKYLKTTMLKVFNYLHHRKTLFLSVFTRSFHLHSCQNHDLLTKSLQKLKQNSILKSTQAKSSQALRLYSLKRLLFSTYSKTCNLALNTWKLFISLNIQKSILMKRCLNRGLHRRYLKSLQLWRETFFIEDLTQKVNKTGTVAIENSLLQEKTQIFELFLKNQAIDPRYFERFMQERESLNLALKRKGVQMLRYRAGLVSSKDKSLTPKYFVSWRLWTVKRKRIIKTSFRLQLYKHKPALIHSFNTWKLHLSLFTSQPRHLLLASLSKLRLQVKGQETQLVSIHNDLAYMKAYSSILEGHTKRGQNLTLVLLRQNIMKTYLQGFLRWVVHCNLCKVHDLLTSLTRTEEKLYFTQSQLKNLSCDYLELEQDNLELRQASLDGVAIADAFETLSKEREKLAVDLADRTATIKKLLEHNNLLTFRLRQFESEDRAENLRYMKY